MINLDMNLVEETLLNFIREEVKITGFKKVVLGISGGIDSALVAALASKALGSENVLGIMMPYKNSSKESLTDAQKVIEKTKIKSLKIPITPMVDAYFANEPNISKLRMGNKMARERMSILFDYAAKEEALVIGTSNKTEILLGYSTQFGDSACAFNPIGSLYKKHVWELAEHLGVPESVIAKKPSADLWEGQTDESELGFSYEVADSVLYSYADLNYSLDKLVASGFDKEICQKIIARNQKTSYKRQLPPVAKLPEGAIISSEKRAKDSSK